MARTRINAISATAVAYTTDDYLPIDGTTNGTRKLPLSSFYSSPNAVSLTTQVTGVLPQANGGTGQTTLGAGTFTATGGTTAISLANRAAQVFSVKDYGAVGDNSTNDTTSIAAAIAAAKSAKGAVYFPAGIYKTSVISISGANGLTLYGDGMGVSTIKTITPSQVINIAESTSVNIFHLTFNGSCIARTAGQQAVNINASKSSFCDNEILSSGEFAAFFGGDTAVTDLIISRNLIRNCFADGINLANVTRAIVSNNMIVGVDDDCIAAGYHGVSSFITIMGNYCKSRNDLGTTWGRGIAILGASDVLVYGNYIESIKQYGILLDWNSTNVRPTRVQLTGNTVKNSPLISGNAVTLQRTTDCIFSDNVILDPATGNSCLEVTDWQNLTIQGGYYAQTQNAFCRGITCSEQLGWAASWDTIKISRVSINMAGASTNSCVYLNPLSAFTMNTGIIDGVVGQQVVAGDYILVGTDRGGTLWKIVNNTTATAGRTIYPATSTGVFTVVNNN